MVLSRSQQNESCTHPKVKNTSFIKIFISAEKLIRNNPKCVIMCYLLISFYFKKHLNHCLVLKKVGMISNMIRRKDYSDQYSFSLPKVVTNLSLRSKEEVVFYLVSSRS